MEIKSNYLRCQSNRIRHINVNVKKVNVKKNIVFVIRMEKNVENSAHVLNAITIKLMKNKNRRRRIFSFKL